MNMFFALVLLAAFAAVGAERRNINFRVDRFTRYLNNQHRQLGTSSAELPEISLGSKVKYSQGIFLGLDSMKRTADCWQEVKGNDIAFDINYGFGLLTLVLPRLEIAGTNMSAYARIRDNSNHISFTVSNFPGKDCHVKLNELRVERLGKVEFGASRPEYDGSNVDGFFQLSVLPTLNEIVKTNFEKIESSLQVMCRVKSGQNGDQLEEVANFLL